MIWALIGCLFITSVIAAVFALKWRHPGLGLVAALTVLALPWLVLKGALPFDLDWGWVAVSYLALVPLLIWWRTRLRGLAGGDVAGATGYGLALLLALAAAVLSGPAALLLVGLIVAAVFYDLSHYERRPQLVYLAATCAVLGLSQLVPARVWPGEAYAIILLLAGVACYALGFQRRDSDPERAQALRISGLAAPCLGCLLGFTSGGAGQAPILALAIVAGLFWAEATLQESRTRQELAGALVVVIFDWLLVTSQVTDLQFFTLPWVAYFAYLAHRRGKAEPGARDLLTAASLAALTLPIAAGSLGPGGFFYSLELIVIGLALMMIGSWQLNRLIITWGAGSALIAVLYAVPQFLAPGSNLPIIMAGLGLAVLAVGVMVSLRSSDT